MVLLSGVQFAYASYLQDIGYSFRPQYYPGRCRVCGGPLHEVGGVPCGSVLHYTEKGSPCREWLRDDMVRDRSSCWVCPACVWQFVCFSDSSLKHLGGGKEKFSRAYVFTGRKVVRLDAGGFLDTVLRSCAYEPPFVVAANPFGIGKRGYHSVLLRSQVAYDSSFYPVVVVTHECERGEVLYVDHRSRGSLPSSGPFSGAAKLERLAGRLGVLASKEKRS